MNFKLESQYKPTGDQPQAIKSLVKGLKSKKKYQVLLGVTGSGKTFTLANVINIIQKPTLVISHNKTLAAQLYQEFREFFPKNAVSYFVSYYDYYQPEAYIPQTDTFIEKETEVNEEIDKLRLEATTNLLTRNDVIVVSSVSCIYNLGSPVEYGKYIAKLSIGEKISLNKVIGRFVELQYSRSEYDFFRGTFRVRGDVLEIWPAYVNQCYRIDFLNERIENITEFDPISGKNVTKNGNDTSTVIIYPAKHYIADKLSLKNSYSNIRKDLKSRLRQLKSNGKELESHRLKQRVEYDLEMIEEFGYVNGIENYSRYFDGRKKGEAPSTLLDHFFENEKDFLVFIDESHITIPQIRGMYNGDKSRKQTLINFGFRLPAALDNRPLNFDEFLKKSSRIIFNSATPGEWEKSISNQVVEQLIRPTGLLDPEIIVRKTRYQINDLISEILTRVKKRERVLVTTLTKKMAEALSEYLSEKKIKVHYIHSEVHTLDRTDILENLRKGKYDVVVGINLLREGLDLPEVSLVAILDADKEGFLRSETSLIQTMGRAARHINGKVILYADNITGSMKRAIKEVNRRRLIQVEYNKMHNIKPKSISKPIREKLVDVEKGIQEKDNIIKISKTRYIDLSELNLDSLTPLDKKILTQKLKKRMHQAAKELDFELAAKIRDIITSVG